MRDRRCVALCRQFVSDCTFVRRHHVAGQPTAGSYALDDAPLANEIRLLLQAALVLFVITVVIGILNGADVVDFSHAKLMTHVHAGTLGWITLSALAASLWLFGSGTFSEGQQRTG